MTKIDRAKKEIDLLFAERDKEIKAAEKDAAIARDDIRTHTAGRNAAAGTDPEKYVEMEKALEADNLNLKMASARCDKIKAAPLFSEDQYNKIKTVLYDTLDDMTTETKQKLEKSTFEMETAGETLRDQWKEADAILKDVFSEMAKDGKRKPNQTADTYAAAIRTYAWSKKAKEFYNCNVEEFHVK